MNERKPEAPEHERFGRTGAHSAPIAVDGPVVAPSTDQAEAADPPEARSHVVYCASEQEVSEGFAIALRAMGLGGSEPWTD